MSDGVRENYNRIVKKDEKPEESDDSEEDADTNKI